MMEACQDPLMYLVDSLCCNVYLDGGGNVRLGFSRRHGLTDMMTAQGIARSHASLLRDRLRQLGRCVDASLPDGPSLAEHVALGPFCPLV